MAGINSSVERNYEKCGGGVWRRAGKGEGHLIGVVVGFAF